MWRDLLICLIGFDPEWLDLIEADTMPIWNLVADAV